MGFADDDVAVCLEDFGGTVTTPDGSSTLAILREGDVMRTDPEQGDVKIGTAALILATGALTLGKQLVLRYQADPDDPDSVTRSFKVRDWDRLAGGRFTRVVVVEA